jgi:integrase
VWLQNAMEFAMIALQGRSEVISAKFEDIDWDRRIIRIIRKKTDKNEWAFLELDISPSLEKVIRRCESSGIKSPFLIHRSPERRRPDKTKEHYTQILPRFFSNEIQKTKSNLSLFECIENKEEHPTFHEIRALGSHLYKKGGYSDEEYVQPLMAHADVAMTKKYQSGHEISWTSVRADLDLDSILDD